uniref:SH2 domain-containing protein n=1 Tax=Ascaris lumbricoides TaxID=6252 RepID=A0A0M3HNQ4_ASCLU
MYPIFNPSITSLIGLRYRRDNAFRPNPIQRVFPLIPATSNHWMPSFGHISSSAYFTNRQTMPGGTASFLPLSNRDSFPFLPSNQFDTTNTPSSFPSARPLSQMPNSSSSFSPTRFPNSLRSPGLSLSDSALVAAKHHRSNEGTKSLFSPNDISAGSIDFNGGDDDKEVLSNSSSVERPVRCMIPLTSSSSDEDPIVVQQHYVCGRRIRVPSSVSWDRPMFAVDESDVPVPYNINSQRPALVCTCPKQLGNQKEQAKVEVKHRFTSAESRYVVRRTEDGRVVVRIVYSRETIMSLWANEYTLSTPHLLYLVRNMPEVLARVPVDFLLRMNAGCIQEEGGAGSYDSEYAKGYYRTLQSSESLSSSDELSLKVSND